MTGNWLAIGGAIGRSLWCWSVFNGRAFREARANHPVIENSLLNKRMSKSVSAWLELRLQLGQLAWSWACFSAKLSSILSCCCWADWEERQKLQASVRELLALFNALELSCCAFLRHYGHKMWNLTWLAFPQHVFWFLEDLLENYIKLFSILADNPQCIVKKKDWLFVKLYA